MLLQIYSSLSVFAFHFRHELWTIIRAPNLTLMCCQNLVANFLPMWKVEFYSSEMYFCEVGFEIIAGKWYFCALLVCSFTSWFHLGMALHSTATLTVYKTMQLMCLNSVHNNTGPVVLCGRSCWFSLSDVTLLHTYKMHTFYLKVYTKSILVK